VKPTVQPKTKKEALTAGRIAALAKRAGRLAGANRKKGWH